MKWITACRSPLYLFSVDRVPEPQEGGGLGEAQTVIIIIIIIIIIQHLYSAMKSGDTEALGGARLWRVKQMSL